jgi:hypothetical protein
LQVITANSLPDGRVVFQTSTGWSREIDIADVLGTKEAVATALERAGRDALANRIVDPYAIDVTRDAGHLTPVRLRERIRLTGPTVGNSLPQRDSDRDRAA